MYDSLDQIHQARSRHRQLATEAKYQRSVNMAWDADAGRQKRFLNNRVSVLKRLARVRRIRVNVSLETCDPCPKVIR